MLLFWVLLIIQNSVGISIEYEDIDSTLAFEILKTAEEVLPEISELVGYEYSGDITIKLISNVEEFRKLTESGIPDWGAGFADTRNSIIVVNSPRVLKRELDLRRITKHELAHLVLSQSVGSRRLPRWFNEGFAMYCSLEWRFGQEKILAVANVTNSLIPLSELELAFPRDVRRAEIAYTESFSALAYIIKNFGDEGFRDILFYLRDKDFEEAIFLSLGITYYELMDEWDTWVKKTYNWVYFLFTGSFILLLMVFIFIILGIKTLLTRQRRMRELEEDMIIERDI